VVARAFVDPSGVPLAVSVTGGQRHDVTQLIPLIDAIGPVAGKRGRPRHRPDALYGDRGFDYDKHRRLLRKRGVRPKIARRGAKHGSGLGKGALGRRAHLRLAAQPPPPAHPLRTLRRPAHGHAERQAASPRRWKRSMRRLNSVVRRPARSGLCVSCRGCCRARSAGTRHMDA
jgi:hypothetical protein